MSTTEHAAAEEEKKPASKEDTNPELGGTIDLNIILDGKEQLELEPRAEKTLVPDDADQPHLLGDPGRSHLLVVQEEENASEKLQIKKKNKKDKKRKRSELLKIKKEQLLGGAEKTQIPVDTDEVAREGSNKMSSSWRWRASYCAKLHMKKKKKVHGGSILLRDEIKCVILLDDDERNIDAYYLKEGESVHPGSVFEFPCYKVDVGERIADEDAINENEKPPSKSDEKRTKCLKRKHQDIENPMRSPQEITSRGMFARAVALRKSMSPLAKQRKSESPSIPNVTAHFPSPNLPRRRRPRKLKFHIWKDFIPLYDHGKVAQGRCKDCHEVLPASQSSGTNHIRRHIKTCVVRRNMYEMVAKLRASTSSPEVTTLDGWDFSQEQSRRDLANMIVQHGLPFSIVEYSGFRKFVKSLNPMFKMVSRTTIREDCMDSYKEERSMLREILKNCGARVSLTADI